MARKSTKKKIAEWIGYNPSNLTPTWQDAVLNFVKPGGSAEQKLGKIKSVDIKSKSGEGPVHKSYFNPNDTADVISARIKGTNGSKVCHIYEDGTGTTTKGGQRD